MRFAYSSAHLSEFDTKDTKIYANYTGKLDKVVPVLK
jgi:hypothetical protein